MVVTAVVVVEGGGGATAGDCLGVAAHGARRVLVSVSRTGMIKRTVGAGGVFLSPAGGGGSKAVAIGTLGVAISLRRFLDLESL